MKRGIALLFGGIVIVSALSAPAGTRYVDLGSPSPTWPYANWQTAATNIQDAVDAAEAGDTVLVTNGVYDNGGRVVFGSLTNRVVVDKPIALQSVSGPAFTWIVGNRLPSGSGNGDAAIRCVYLTNGSSLCGFTLTNGATRYFGGGSIYFEQSGGAVWVGTNDFALISNCVVAANSAAYYGGGGSGGCYASCVFTTNSAYQGGAANVASLVNCRLERNRALAGGAGARYSSLTNCTIVGNRSSDLTGGGTLGGAAQNCLFYQNISSAKLDNYAGGLLEFCCVAPMPAGGTGNITNDPALVDTNNWADLRLQTNSPCINAGNNASATSGTDLDGNSRISGGTVDMGAYELQSPSSVLSYAWAEQYGLPTDGSADFVDTDGEGADNYHEWRSDTVPTDATSALRMRNVTNSGNGLAVSWDSVATRTYILQRADDFGLSPSFQTVATNIPGIAGVSTFNDASATNAGPYFYRVRVQ